MNEKTMEFGIKYFQELWHGRPRGSSFVHSPEIWDSRADEWISEIAADPGKRLARVLDTADFLRSRGVLTSDSDVVDVGCGPGLFAAEFAKTSKSAVGLDYSRRFVGYAEGEALAAGIRNVRYEYCDFAKDDTSRYDGKFDLAFSSITPATNTWELMEKFMRLSRAFCCNVSFVNIKDTLGEQICSDIFNESFKPRRSGTGFYALLNIVWLSGYYPEIHYYDDVREDLITPTRENAEYYAGLCSHNEPGNTEKILRWLENKGKTLSRKETRYGAILWDLRRKDRR